MRWEKLWLEGLLQVAGLALESKGCVIKLYLLVRRWVIFVGGSCRNRRRELNFTRNFSTLTRNCGRSG